MNIAIVDECLDHPFVPDDFLRLRPRFQLLVDPPFAGFHRPASPPSLLTLHVRMTRHRHEPFWQNL